MGRGARYHKLPIVAEALLTELASGYDLAQDLRLSKEQVQRMMKPFLIFLLSITGSTAALTQSLATWEDSLVIVTDSLMLSEKLEVR